MPIRLGLPGIKVSGVLRDDTEALEVGVQIIQATIRCGSCGRKTRRVHQLSTTKVRDLPAFGRRTTLVWARRRFICGACGSTTTETHPQLEGRLTGRLRRALVAEVVDSTVAAVARRHGLSWYQVMAVVLVAATLVGFHRRHSRVRVLMIDEKALVKGHNGFSTILSDGESAKVITVLEGRSGLTQRFHRVYEARGTEDGFAAIEEFCEAAEAALVDLGSAMSTLWRWREQWIGFHGSRRRTNAVAEGVNAKIEVLERKAYGLTASPRRG